MRRLYVQDSVFVSESVYNPQLIGSELREGTILLLTVYKDKNLNSIWKHGIIYSPREKLLIGKIIYPLRLKGLEIILHGIPKEELKEKIENMKILFNKGYMQINKTALPMYTSLDLPSKIALKITYIELL